MMEVLDLSETLAQELERPRKISAQVARHLVANYGIADDETGPFLVQTLPTLEEDEIDLILSPLFTPKLADQAVFAGRLGRQSIPSDELVRLVVQVVARPTDASLAGMDDQNHRVRLGEVTVERYVYRLRLEATIPEATFELIQRHPSGDYPLFQAVARRATWEGDGRSGILRGYLMATAGIEAWGAAEVRSLLDLVDRYKPIDIADLVAKIPRWQEGLRSDLSLASGRKPFFSEGIEHSHGGERDHRSPEGALIEAKRRELSFLERLELLLVH